MWLPVSKGHRPVRRTTRHDTRASWYRTRGNSTTLIVGYSSGLELVASAQYRPVVDTRRATRLHKRCYVFRSFSIRMESYVKVARRSFCFLIVYTGNHLVSDQPSDHQTTWFLESLGDQVDQTLVDRAHAHFRALLRVFPFYKRLH